MSTKSSLTPHDAVLRVFYFIKLETAVLIFHAFQKKTPKTPPPEVKLARARLKEML